MLLISPSSVSSPRLFLSKRKNEQIGMEPGEAKEEKKSRKLQIYASPRSE
jgi:hypothetical protein